MPRAVTARPAAVAFPEVGDDVGRLVENRVAVVVHQQREELLAAELLCSLAEALATGRAGIDEDVEVELGEDLTN